MLESLRKQLRELAEKRATLSIEMRAVLDTPKAEERELTEAEAAAFAEKRGALVETDGKIVEISERISALEEDEKRGKVAASILADSGHTGPKSGGAVVKSEPQTYARGNGNSYFLDLAKATLRGDSAASVRLSRHAAELDVELPARQAAREERARRDQRGIEEGSIFEKRVNPSRTDGQGGYFVPPLWLVDQYVNLPRFGRTVANLVNGMDLPAGTDSINVPKISTGTATGMQTADAAAVTSTDMTDTFVTAPVRTIAGQQDVAMQLLDQSPIAFDEVIYGDLLADLNAAEDLQVINGSGSSGQVRGILNVSGINAITYTDASPTLPEMYLPLVQSASQVASNRKLPATGVVMTPSMWYWANSQLDTTNRPLIVPPAVAFNPTASSDGLAEDGPAGMLSYGIPAYVDGNIPSNLGGGSNETRVITARWSDLYLWEGPVRTRVLTEILSGTLQVRFQVYRYFAFMADRRPTAISVISGTGVIPTAGF